MMSVRGAVLFDVTRLMIRMSLKTPTGIDRTTEAYGAHLLDRPDLDVIPVCSWGGVLWPMRRRWLQVILDRTSSSHASDQNTWIQLQAALTQSAPTGAPLRATSTQNQLRATLKRYLPSIMRTLVEARPTAVPPGAIYLNVSHFGLEQPGLLARLARQGIRSVAMVHDLIPIEHPEFCSPNAAVLHARRIDGLLDHASLIISNSAATADAVRRHASKRGSRLAPLCVAPLGLEPVFFRQPRPFHTARPYFVCVGTLEPRKNLALLLTLWRRIAERLGDATPLLILVGRRGWENEAIIDHLERSPPILRYVHEVSGLDDERLAQLIAGARALLAPSFAEGFDLPFHEAVSLGAPIIASDIPVHREVAGVVRLVDPLDGLGWLAAIEALINEPQVGRVGAQPTWASHFAAVEAAMGIEPAVVARSREADGRGRLLSRFLHTNTRVTRLDEHRPALQRERHDQ